MRFDGPSVEYIDAVVNGERYTFGVAPEGPKVVIPSVPDAFPVAHYALSTEGIAHEIVMMRHETSYSELLTALWKQGDTFTIVEQDVAPFPGALETMWRCHSYWCARAYHLNPAKLRPAFGCVRVHADLVREHPDLWQQWDDEHWMTLDATAYRVLESITPLHVHDPGVAHVKMPVPSLAGQRLGG